MRQVASSINFSVLVYVIKFLDPSVDDPISCTILLLNSNSNGNPFADSSLLIGTYSSNGLKTSKEGYGSTPFVYNPVAYRPSCVCFCCWYKCYWKC